MRRAVLLVPVLIVAGCSSSGGGRHGSSSSAGSSNAAAPAAALERKMTAGLTGLTSAHVVVDAGELGGTSSGDFSFADGKATASDITLGTGSQRTEIITIGATSYAKLPGGRNTTGKPWVKVSATSSNEFVRALSSQLTLSKAAASLPAIAQLAGTASSVRQTSADTYALTIEPAKSSGTTLGALLADIGQKSVPVTLTIDAKGRPVHIVISPKLGSQAMRVTVSISRFDAPVHVNAPPKAQIATN